MTKPPRVVNDTNIWLSALYFSGKPANIVKLIEEKEAISVTSRYILNELKDKMVTLPFNTPSFAANATIAYIASISEIVQLQGKNFGLRDEADNQVLETAVNGKCDFLITGDNDLLTIKKYQDIQIVNSNQFLVKYKK